MQIKEQQDCEHIDTAKSSNTRSRRSSPPAATLCPAFSAVACQADALPPFSAPSSLLSRAINHSPMPCMTACLHSGEHTPRIRHIKVAVPSSARVIAHKQQARKALLSCQGHLHYVMSLPRNYSYSKHIATVEPDIVVRNDSTGGELLLPCTCG